MHTQQLEKYYLDNQKEIDQIYASLENLPDGKLNWSRTGKHFKFINHLGDDYQYIKAKDRSIAAQLAEKKVLLAKLDDLLTEQKAIEKYQKICAPCGKELEKILTADSPIPELLNHKYLSQSDAITNWLKEEYETNTAYPDSLVIKASNGLMVRSKSEAMIIAELEKNHIPFRYECKLELQNGVYYPDFTILHPYTLKLFYWEHFGVMDDPLYIQKSANKISSFAYEGIVLGINFFITSETSSNPLGFEAIDQTIEMILSRG